MSLPDPTDKVLAHLAQTISLVTAAIKESTDQRQTEFDWLRLHSGLATKADLKEMEKRIMSAISDYAGRVDVAFTAIGDNVDAAVTSLTGLTADVASLKALIEKLQTSPGTITPEDQALLDAAEAKLNALATKTTGLKEALAQLDAQTEEPPAPTP